MITPKFINLHIKNYSRSSSNKLHDRLALMLEQQKKQKCEQLSKDIPEVIVKTATIGVAFFALYCLHDFCQNNDPNF